MSLDLTLAEYEDLCEAIAYSGYAPMTVRAYLEARELPSRLVVMRHDVDTTPKNEPEMALIEKDSGIRATYYFRYKRGVFRPGGRCAHAGQVWHGDVQDPVSKVYHEGLAYPGEMLLGAIEAKEFLATGCEKSDGHPRWCR